MGIATQDDANKEFTVPAVIKSHAAWHRLEDQRRYYSETSRRYQRYYRRIKLVQIVLGASIPLIAVLPGLPIDVLKVSTAACGATLAALEAILQLNQWHALWLEYRATSERLKREQWMLLSRAGDYRGKADDDALILLAERTEVLMAAERDNWTTTIKHAGKEPIAARPEALAA